MSQADHRQPDPVPSEPDRPRRSDSEATLRRIGAALQGLRFGSVLAIVQDGVVVQIERTEKTRFNR
jgi:hypothetical protein